MNFMELAIKEAEKSEEPIRCGVVIVKDSKVIAKGFNSQRSLNDVSAHAEINALRKAGKRVRSKYLDGCEIYCTCEPCTMCLSAIIFARIQKMTYGSSLRDLPTKGFINISIKDFLKKSPRKIAVSRCMERECRMINQNKGV